MKLKVRGDKFILKLKREQAKTLAALLNVIGTPPGSTDQVLDYKLWELLDDKLDGEYTQYSVKEDDGCVMVYDPDRDEIPVAPPRRSNSATATGGSLPRDPWMAIYSNVNFVNPVRAASDAVDSYASAMNNLRERVTFIDDVPAQSLGRIDAAE